jgi:hypothetical protein
MATTLRLQQTVGTRIATINSGKRRLGKRRLGKGRLGKRRLGNRHFTVCTVAPRISMVFTSSAIPKSPAFLGALPFSTLASSIESWTWGRSYDF